VSRLPVVAIVGAPNVGKSTLVNRIVGGRRAVVSETPGTTRDRTYRRAEWAGREFVLVDTGGMEPAAKVGLEALVTLQAKLAAEEADVILHLTDSRLGPTEVDSAVARALRQAPGRVVLAVNKLDNPADDSERYPFYGLGEGEPHAISAEHGLGVGDLLDTIVSHLPKTHNTEEERLPRIAIVGRPNVGKSTLLNRLLDTERAVVSEVAGTTTDAVETELEHDGERYLLLDTAGVGRRSKRAEGVPYYSMLRTYEAIRRSDISLLVVDARDGLVGGDLQVASEISEARRACGVVVNKRDAVSGEELREIYGHIAYRMTDLKPPVISVSALEGGGVEEVIPLAAELYRAYNFSIRTHEVAEFINEVVNRSAPPYGVKIRYATQTGQAPPTFTIFANRPKDIPDSYVRYLENSLRERYGLYGVSLRLKFKSSR
jgi:GTP-binding protein